MDPSDLGFIKGAVAFALLAATGLTTYWLRLRAKLMTQKDPPALDRVQDDLARTRADLEARILELEERLDFAERRLLREPIPQAPAKLPKVVTPV